MGQGVTGGETVGRHLRLMGAGDVGRRPRPAAAKGAEQVQVQVLVLEVMVGSAVEVPAGRGVDRLKVPHIDARRLVFA